MMNAATRKAGVCLAALISGMPAAADVTAQDVWNDYKDMLAIYGEGLTIGSEVVTSDSVTISDIQMAFDDGFSTITGTMGEIVFRDVGDGTVRIEMAEDYPIRFADENGDGVSMSLFHSGLNIIASGDPGALNYSFAADQYGMRVDEVTEDGSALPVDARVSMSGLSGSYTVTGTEIKQADFTFMAAALDMLLDVNDPEGEGTVVISGQLSGLNSVGSSTMPDGFSFVDMLGGDPSALFGSGYTSTSDASLDSMAFIFDINADGTQAAGSIDAGASTFSGGYTETGIAYDTRTADLTFDMTSSDIPLPVSVSAAEYGIGFAMPLTASEGPADFGLRIGLVDVAVPDELWQFAGPLAALPNGPATLIADITGSGKLFFDMMDPEQQMAMAMADVPGELYDMTLNGLEVRALGAEITGNGAFTFDNTDLETFDGLPRPAGEVTFNITGANALVDQLVAVGLIPEDQAMMGRMMIGMFAQTVGDDMLTSTITVNDEGHVLANGQRIR